MPFLSRTGELATSSPVNLGAVLREAWSKKVEALRLLHYKERSGQPPADPKRTAAEVKEWKAEQFPEMGAVEDQGDWNPDYDDLSVVVRAVSGRTMDRFQDTLRSATVELEEARKRARARLDGEEVSAAELFAASTNASHARADAQKLLVTEGIAKIVGFEDSSGPYTIAAGPNGIAPRLVDGLEEAGVLTGLCAAVQTFNMLSEAERKNFGGQVHGPATPEGIAALARTENESGAGAMAPPV